MRPCTGCQAFHSQHVRSIAGLVCENQIARKCDLQSKTGYWRK